MQSANIPLIGKEIPKFVSGHTNLISIKGNKGYPLAALITLALRE
jgi:hypothetical protein